jgi:hypothetical protein
MLWLCGKEFLAVRFLNGSDRSVSEKAFCELNWKGWDMQAGTHAENKLIYSRSYGWFCLLAFTVWGSESLPLGYVTTCDKNIRGFMKKYCKKWNQSHYRSGQALWVPGGWGSQISRQKSHEDGKVVSPTQRPPLPPRKYSWYSFLLIIWVDPRAIVLAGVLCQWTILVTPTRIEPATSQLVA